MATVCFASVKGGVGKTSVSVNVTHAFAKRGCKTLIVDCDPTAHATRYLSQRLRDGQKVEAPLAHLFFHANQLKNLGDTCSDTCSDTCKGLSDDLVEKLFCGQQPLLEEVRENVSLLSSGSELRHFLWGRGAKAFKVCFQELVSELQSIYDVIIIDTPPDYNILTRNAIAVSDLVVVPVDSSEMSINSLEELVTCASHIEGPRWAIVRTMVNRVAKKVRAIRDAKLEERFSLISPKDMPDEENLLNSQEFISMLQEREAQNGSDLAGDFSSGAAVAEGISFGSSQLKSLEDDTEGEVVDSPIYLLENLIRRTELHNKLSYFGRTAFDTAESKDLASQYSALASEIEEVLSLIEEERGGEDFSEVFNLNQRA